jgi:hypothetical protein
VLHQLWINESAGEQTFCCAGPRGDSARSLLQPGAKLVWTVEAESWFEAMTKYYAYMGWGEYGPADLEFDMRPYSSQP